MSPMIDVELVMGLRTQCIRHWDRLVSILDYPKSLNLALERGNGQVGIGSKYFPTSNKDSDIVAPFDATTQFLFDHAYYGNLLKKLGMLASDQALALEPRTKSIVQDLAKDKQKFIQAFVGAMDKLS
ncbi:hypothetical protein JHK85_019758 [Glycine max]|nr:hypothetical protein JHK85_019758 [Glycine max]